MRLTDLIKEFGDIEVPKSIRRCLFTSEDCYNEMINITKEVMDNFKGDTIAKKGLIIVLDKEYFTLEDKIHTYKNSIKIDNYSMITDEIYYYYVEYGVHPQIMATISDKSISHINMYEEILMSYLAKMRHLGYVQNYKSRILNEK